jgi:glutaredoxin
MKEPIKLYGSSGCPMCIGAKKYLEQRDVPFEYIDVREDPEGMKALEDLGASTIPVITWRDLFIAGFSQKTLDRLIQEVHKHGDA